MIQKVKSIWMAILSALLSMLGLHSCHSFRVEYGCPHADYKFQGSVTGDGKPVSGIRAVVFNGSPDNKYNAVDTSYTDASGKTERNLPISIPSTELCVKFEDVDGPENGSWQTKIMPRDQLEIVQTALGDGKWDEGDYTIKASAELQKAE